MSSMPRRFTNTTTSLFASFLPHVKYPNLHKASYFAQFCLNNSSSKFLVFWTNNNMYWPTWLARISLKLKQDTYKIAGEI